MSPSGATDQFSRYAYSSAIPRLTPTCLDSCQGMPSGIPQVPEHVFGFTAMFNPPVAKLWRDLFPSLARRTLQRAQEVQYLLLLRRTRVGEILLHAE